MKHTAGIVAMAALLQAGSAMAIVDRYALPRTKAYLEPCRKAALALHPGVVKEFRVLNRDDGFYFRFDIREPDGSKWVILCDGLTGKIVREQKLDDF